MNYVDIPSGTSPPECMMIERMVNEYIFPVVASPLARGQSGSFPPPTSLFAAPAAVVVAACTSVGLLFCAERS